MNKFLFLILKLSISATLLYVLLTKLGAESLLSTISLLNPLAFIAAVFIYILATVLSSRRWGLFIPQRLRTRRLFSLYMVGSFFNVCLPGIVGGDAVKAYYLSKTLKASNASAQMSATHLEEDLHIPHVSDTILAVASIFMDRYIGFFALLSLGMAVFPFSIVYLRTTQVQWLLPLLFITFIAVSFLLFRFQLGKRVRPLLHIYEYLRLYISKRKVMVHAFLYSLCVQLLGIIAIYMLSRGLAIEVPFLVLIIFIPIIIVISMLPLSISGIGLREGAFVFLLGLVGVSPEKAMALSIVWFLSVVIASLWGLIKYLRFKAEFGGKVEEQPL